MKKKILANLHYATFRPFFPPPRTSVYFLYFKEKSYYFFFLDDSLSGGHGFQKGDNRYRDIRKGDHRLWDISGLDSW